MVLTARAGKGPLSVSPSQPGTFTMAVFSRKSIPCFDLCIPVNVVPLNLLVSPSYVNIGTYSLPGPDNGSELFSASELDISELDCSELDSNELDGGSELDNGKELDCGNELDNGIELDCRELDITELGPAKLENVKKSTPNDDDAVANSGHGQSEQSRVGQRMRPVPLHTRSHSGQFTKHGSQPGQVICAVSM